MIVKMKLITMFAVFSMLSIGCGKKDSDDKGDDGQSENQIDPSTGFSSSGVNTMQLQMISTGGLSIPVPVNLTAPEVDKYYHSRTIIAGAPEDLIVHVTELKLANSETNLEVPIFSYPEGKPLRISGTTVDMSQFFTEIKCMDNDGTVLDFECPCGADQDGNPIEKEEIENEDGEKELSCPALEEGQSPPVALVQVSQEGTFDTLKVSLLNTTDVKGCVGNYIRQDDWGTSDTAKYTDNVAFENYCTRKSFTMETALAGTATESSEFLSTADDAQWTTSRLSLNPDHGDSFNMEFPIKEGITISESSDDKPNITMLIDTSRILRFFKRDNYEDRSRPDGGTETEQFKGSYFYINRIGSQNFVFVGRPGTIRGYRYQADSSRTEDDSDATPPTTVVDGSEYEQCSRTNEDCFDYGGGWVTVVFDSDGEPLLISIQPDDNNTGIKYANQSKDGIDTSVFKQTSSGVYKIETEFKDGNGSPWIVKLYNLDTSISVGSSVDSYFYQYLESADGSDSSETWGVMHLERGL